MISITQGESFYFLDTKMSTFLHVPFICMLDFGSFINSSGVLIIQLLVLGKGKKKRKAFFFSNVGGEKEPLGYKETPQMQQNTS